MGIESSRAIILAHSHQQACHSIAAVEVCAGQNRRFASDQSQSRAQCASCSQRARNRRSCETTLHEASDRRAGVLRSGLNMHTRARSGDREPAAVHVAKCTHQRRVSSVVAQKTTRVELLVSAGEKRGVTTLQARNVARIVSSRSIIVVSNRHHHRRESGCAPNLCLARSIKTGACVSSVGRCAVEDRHSRSPHTRTARDRFIAQRRVKAGIASRATDQQVGPVLAA